MEVKTGSLEERMNHFENVCREREIKLTHQRIEIFREVAMNGEHPDAEQVYKGVRERIPTVSLDTVYRTLWMLKDLGLVQTLGMSNDRTRFDANLQNHHHFICNDCGFTRDFYSEEFDHFQLPDSINEFGEVETAHIEVRGLCRQCAARRKHDGG